MKLLNLERMIENKFNLLLIVELLICILFPASHLFQTRFPLSTALLLLALFFAMHLVLPRKTFIVIFILGLLVFSINILANYHLITSENQILTIILSLYAIFFMLTIIALVIKISSWKTITSDTVKGGISIYFLLSLFWAILYMLIVHLQPNSFLGFSQDRIDFIYYSIVTITTLGYGDITPVTSYAKMLSSLEAFIGQIYIAIFIAQLVGMRIINKFQM